jgi:hypothetical protein
MAMITSIETTTSLGMPIFMHNASSKKRAGEAYLNCAKKCPLDG